MNRQKLITDYVFQTAVAEAEMANLPYKHLDTCERKYVEMRSGPMSTMDKFTRRDGLLAVAALACLFLLNGRFAAHACTLLTSVPAAIFTYKVLSIETSSPVGYRSVLFYWVLQGSLGLLDIFLYESYGYFLAKFVLMSLAFGHAASQNKEAFQKMVNTDSLKEDITQCITSVVSMYDTDGFPVQSPLPAGGDSSSEYMDGASTALSIDRSDDMMSTQQKSPEKPFICSVQKSLEKREKRSEECPNCVNHAVNRALTPHPDGDTCLSPQESECTVALGFGDIITNPMEKLFFGKVREVKYVTVTNVSQKTVIWALKSNALHRLGAAPAYGIITRGGKAHIKVTYLEKGEGDGDKLAIDYALVGSHHAYSPAFLELPGKKRYLLRIHYAL